MHFLVQIPRDWKIELFSQGTEDCQNLRYEKSDYCWSQTNRNYQSRCIEYKIVTERNQYILTLNKWILMNILEFDNHPLSAIILHPKKQKVKLLYIYNHATVIRLSYLRFIELSVAWEKSLKLDVFSPLEFEANCNFDYKTFKLNPHSIRASEWYMNNKNPIYGQETASIFSILCREFWIRPKYLCIHL